MRARWLAMAAGALFAGSSWAGASVTVGVDRAPPAMLRCGFKGPTVVAPKEIANEMGPGNAVFELEDGTWTLSCTQGDNGDKTLWKLPEVAVVVDQGQADLGGADATFLPGPRYIRVTDATDAVLDTGFWIAAGGSTAPATQSVRRTAASLIERIGNEEKQADFSSGGTPVSPAIEDVLKLVADVAVEEARSRAGEAVQARLERLVCRNLVIDESSDTFLRTVDDAGDRELAFPETCSVLRHHSLPELVQAGEMLSTALETDLIELALRLAGKLVPKLQGEGAATVDHVKRLAERILPSLLGHLLSGTPPDDADLKRILFALADGEWSPDDVGTCSVGVVIQAAAECLGADECELDDIVGKVDAGLEHCGVEKDPWLEANRSKIQAVAADIVDLVQSAETTARTTDEGRARTRRGLEIAFRALDLAFSAAEYNAEPPRVEGACPPKRAIIAARRLTSDIRDLALAALAGSATSVVGAGGTLVADAIAQSAFAQCASPTTAAKAQRKIAQLVPIVTVLTAAGTDASSDEADHRARKEALKSAIRAATVRRGRGGDIVASLGVNVGGLGFLSIPTETDKQPQPTAGLTLPVGVSVELLPPGRIGQHFQPVGFHGQLFALDLGQLVNTDLDEQAFYWNDFLAVGVQAGALFGGPTTGFSAGIDLRYRPVGSAAGKGQVGLYLSWYVPFFDVN